MSKPMFPLPGGQKLLCQDTSSLVSDLKIQSIYSDYQCEGTNKGRLVTVGCALYVFKSDIDVCMRNNKHDFIVASLNKPISPS